MYNNGFQSLPIDSSFIRDLELYDEHLFVWRGEDGYYHISHNPKRKSMSSDEQYLKAKETEVIRIQDEEGEPRIPTHYDFNLLMSNDLSRQSVRDIINRLDDPLRKKKEQHQKNLESMYKQAMLDLKRDMSLHPHKY